MNGETVNVRNWIAYSLSFGELLLLLLLVNDTYIVNNFASQMQTSMCPRFTFCHGSRFLFPLVPSRHHSSMNNLCVHTSTFLILVLNNEMNTIAQLRLIQHTVKRQFIGWNGLWTTYNVHTAPYIEIHFYFYTFCSSFKLIVAIHFGNALKFVFSENGYMHNAQLHWSNSNFPHENTKTRKLFIYNAWNASHRKIKAEKIET